MSLQNANIFQACCSITASAAGGGVAPTFLVNQGFDPTFAGGSTHTATGVYALALVAPVDATQCVFMLTFRSNADASGGVLNTSDGVKTVKTFAAGAADDTVSFDLTVLAMPNNTP